MRLVVSLATFVICSVAALPVGAQENSLTSTQLAARQPSAGYRTVVVKPTTVAMTALSIDLLEDFPLFFQKSLVGELKKSHVFDEVIDGALSLGQRPDSTVPEGSPRLAMETTIIEFDKGSPAKRIWIGNGAGAPMITVLFAVKDLTTGTEILRQTERAGKHYVWYWYGLSSIGVSDSTAVRKASDRVISEFIRDLRKTTLPLLVQGTPQTPAGADLEKRAQTSQNRVVARSFAELQGRLAPGQTVYVIDDGRRETKGTVRELSASTLALMVDGQPREFSQSQVWAINERHGGAGKGALVGLAVGGGLGLWGLAAGCGNSEICGYAQLGLVFAAGFGALTGGIVGAEMERHRVLYLAPTQSSAHALAIAPLVSPDRRGVMATIRF
jgi:Domain of unknown function (DUF4410)